MERGIHDERRRLQRLYEEPIERAVRKACERQGRKVYRAVPAAEEPEVALEMPHLGEIQADTSSLGLLPQSLAKRRVDWLIEVRHPR